VAASEAFKVGSPADADTFQGPQVSKAQFEKILGYIEEGKKGGAKLLTGGGRHGTRGYYVQPTVFGDVTNDMKIAQEEIFGPVAAVLRFKTEEEAIKIANDTEVGLGVVGKRDGRRADGSTVWARLCTRSMQTDCSGSRGSSRRARCGRTK
jgi:acyl-CoA reductase-like NAD-dependent aldehyde dehydrogenase